MQIKIEDLTPKNLINFYPEQKICSENTAALFVKNEANLPEFVGNVLNIEGVTQCLVADKLIGVSFENSADKEDLTALVLAELDDYFAAGQKMLDFAPKAATLPFIEALADSFVRPTLNRDKGDIKILAYENNLLRLRFIGHCAGCPYAKNTLTNVVGACFKRYVPCLEHISAEE